jgi:hypothetical protein
MSKTFSEQLRRAITADGRSRYAIGKAADVDKASLARFMAGKVGLSLPAIDRLVDVLGLELKPRTEHKTTKGEAVASSPAPLIQSPKRTGRRTGGKPTPKVR